MDNDNEFDLFTMASLEGALQALREGDLSEAFLEAASAGNMRALEEICRAGEYLNNLPKLRAEQAKKIRKFDRAPTASIKRMSAQRKESSRQFMIRRLERFEALAAKGLRFNIHARRKSEFIQNRLNALDEAVDNKRPEVALFLLKKGVKISRAFRGKLRELAVETGSMNMVRLMARQGVTFDGKPVNKKYFLRRAVEKNHTEMALFLIRARADQNEGYAPNDRSSRSTLLCVAVRNRNYRLAHALDEINPSIHDWYSEEPPFLVAVRNRDLKIAELLLKDGQGHQTNRQGENAWHIAVKNNDFEMLELLARYTPENISEPDKEGNTPLHGVAGPDAKRVALFLVKHGASVDVKNKAGQIPEVCTHYEISDYAKERDESRKLEEDIEKELRDLGFPYLK